MSTSYTAKGDEQGKALLPYLISNFFLSQNGTDTPEFSFTNQDDLKLISGGGVINRLGIGVYSITKEGAFPQNKTINNTIYSNPNSQNVITQSQRLNDNTIELYVLAAFDSSAVDISDIAFELPFQVQVYK
jgi:hypothetical protein